MVEFEKICADEKAWTRYNGGGEGDICVYRRCPECGKYLKEGKVTYGGVEGWTCKVHGEVEPFWLRD